MRILFITTCFIAQFTGLFAQFLNLKDKTVYKDSTLKALYSGILRLNDEEGNLLMSGPILNGKRNGLILTYHKNGKLDGRMYFKDNKINGPIIYYSEVGKVVVRGNVVSDKQEGHWKWYYPNGQLSSDGFFKNGIKEGLWVFYYENGRIQSKGSYKMDKPFGNWLGFEENGTLEYTELTVKLPEAK
jgi:antitoxin component YwqK of YwqJK toxin-antitoxin module